MKMVRWLVGGVAGCGWTEDLTHASSELDGKPWSLDS